MRRPLFILCLLVLAILPNAAMRADAATPAAVAADSSADVQNFLRLLGSSDVQKRVAAQQASAAATAPVARESLTDRVTDQMHAVASRLEAAVAAIPTLPAEIAAAFEGVQAELTDAGLARMLFLTAAFVLLGFGLEALFRRVTADMRRAAAEYPATSLAPRLRSIGTRLGLGLAAVAVFGFGTVGAFMLFSWPPLLHRVVLTYLLAFLAARLVVELVSILLVPRRRESEDPEAHRVIPATTQAAAFWHRRLAIGVGYLAVCLATLDLLPVLGVAPDAQAAVAHLVGLGALLLCLETIWRRPKPVAGSGEPSKRWMTRSALLTVYALLLVGIVFVGAPGLLALGVVAILLPLALSIIDATVEHLTRHPPEAEKPAGDPEVDRFLAVFLDRGLRVLVVIGCVILLAWSWNVDLVALTSGGETMAMRAGRAVLSIVVIFLVADVLWQILNASVERKLAGPMAAPGSEAAIRDARLRTLLPILRNISMVVIASCAVLMALSELGVQIAPLIAGAGVLGVAVGFGAQTVVKDIISGIFYLLDDAFRVGEFIQSGSYAGTVESFSLRSIRLRAARGPVFTIPFGELGAVENLSRDYAIDKYELGVTYDTDIDKARKLIRKVGEQLKADPELGPMIIEPLKMQGVQEFGAYAIQLRVKITTLPGVQTTIRRKAYALIKKAFDENGIEFAFPTVQLAGGGTPDPATAGPAVASEVLKLA